MNKRIKKKKLKLVFLIDNNKNIGGGEYAQFKFAQMLAKKGHKITIFSGDKTFLSEELELQKNLKIFYKSTIPIYVKKVGIGKINNLKSNLHTKNIIEPYVKDNEPDWIIGYLKKSAVKAVKIGKKHDVKVANFIFESPPWLKTQLSMTEWNKELRSRGFKQSWETARVAYQNSDVLIPNSKLSGKKCKEWIPEAKISEPVYPGVEFIKIPNKTKDIDVVCIGRLNKLKNQDELIRAISLTKKNLRVIFIGAGEEKNNLVKLAKSLNVNAKFLGHTNEHEKWIYLSRSKILVFPTSFEGFGMPPMEGLQSGCNVLCSNIPILKEIYEKNVEYFKLHDIKDMAKKIEKLLKIKPKNKTTFVKKYSWENAAKTIEKILENTMKK